MNHTSNVEPPILFHALSPLFPRLRVLYKAELRKLPILVRAWDLAGFVPLERGNPEQSLPAIDRAAEALREGNSFLIFPEGTRSRTGSLLPFKKGGFIMAIKGQAPIVPTAITGAREAMQQRQLRDPAGHGHGAVRQPRSKQPGMTLDRARPAGAPPSAARSRPCWRRGKRWRSLQRSAGRWVSRSRRVSTCTRR